MHAEICTCIHACMHENMYRCTHAYTRIFRCIRKFSIIKCTKACTHMCIYMDKETKRHICIHAKAYTCKRSCSICMHADMHTNIYTKRIDRQVFQDAQSNMHANLSLVLPSFECPVFCHRLPPSLHFSFFDLVSNDCVRCLHGSRVSRRTWAYPLLVYLARSFPVRV